MEVTKRTLHLGLTKEEAEAAIKIVGGIEHG